MMAITYDEKAAPWSRSSHLLGTRLLPSRDNSDNNFFEPPCRTRTESQQDHDLLNYTALSPFTPILSLFKSKAYVSTPKMG
jgi:hypothetical protein